MTERTHFIGIGGAGMSGIARLWAQRPGVKVSGSDGKDSAILADLEKNGIQTWVGHDGTRIDGASQVVVSTAIRNSNPELVRARELELPILHRSEALALLSAQQELIAVAGTHGKTTTSAMIATVLVAVGLQPSYVIGGQIIGSDGSLSSAVLDAGSPFVIEADESDGSFVNYHPKIAVVTNLEPDHLDFYGDADSYRHAFLDFLRTVDSTGALVVCVDDPGTRVVADVARDRELQVLSYGRTAESTAQIIETRTEGRASIVRLSVEGECVEYRLGVPGEHNVLNSVAAILAIHAFLKRHNDRVDLSSLATAMESFRGTKRRFELVGESRGVRIVDDYAHHPTEVAAVLSAARQAVGEGRIIVLFQPHLYSRTRIFMDEFAAVLSAADIVIVTEIYAAREDPEPGISGQLICSKIDTQCMGEQHVNTGEVHFAQTLENAIDIVDVVARPMDLILTVGAGDVTSAGATLLERLAARQ